MLFNSFAYLVFLPIVFILYWMIFKSVRGRNLLIIAASYFFYGWWDWRFLLLFFAETLICFFSVQALGGCMRRGRRTPARLWLWLNVLIGFGILFVFKYFDFFAHSLQRVLGAAGWQLDWVSLNLVLPIGISFYTFQLISYAVDVYRGNMKPEKDATVFFAYISFFPQLVAGPIERATNLIPQFARQRRFSYDEGVEGLKMILWGLFKKILVADNCATAVDRIFYQYADVGALNLWAGLLLFTMQIYGDFSGYSDIAVGSARLFGIRLMQNFRHPYLSRSPGEFWRRWHISLSSWLRDYVYIPLGGSRRGKWSKNANLIATFLVSGLWHGAAVTYIAWGVYHGVAVVAGSTFAKKLNRLGPADAIRRRHIAAIIFTFFVVAFGWLIFRAPNLSMAAGYFRLMFTDWRPAAPPAFDFIIFIWCALTGIFSWMAGGRECGFDFPLMGVWRYRGVRWAFYLIMVWLILILGGNTHQFVYFQF